MDFSRPLTTRWWQNRVTIHYTGASSGDGTGGISTVEFIRLLSSMDHHHLIPRGYRPLSTVCAYLCFPVSWYHRLTLAITLIESMFSSCFFPAISLPVVAILSTWPFQIYVSILDFEPTVDEKELQDGFTSAGCKK